MSRPKSLAAALPTAGLPLQHHACLGEFDAGRLDMEPSTSALQLLAHPLKSSQARAQVLAKGLGLDPLGPLYERSAGAIIFHDSINSSMVPFPCSVL